MPVGTGTQSIGSAAPPELLFACTEAGSGEGGAGAECRRQEEACSAKMLLDLSEEHKEHLAFLPQVDSAGKGVRGACGGDSPGSGPMLTAS